jgi:hypothetical protein
MPTKLSNFNFFILQDRDSSLSRPLRGSEILWCYLRIDARSLVGDTAAIDAAFLAKAGECRRQLNATDDCFPSELACLRDLELPRARVQL